MSTPDVDVAARLVAAGIGLTLGTNLFRGKERPPAAPGIPHKAVFCLASGGAGPQAYADGTALQLRYPSVQVFVRSDPNDFAAGQTLARAVRDALHHATVAGYVNVEVVESEPNYLSEDEQGHHLWTVNVDLLLEE